MRRIEASFRKRGNSLSGNPWLASLGPGCGFCVLVSTVCRLCLLVGCSVARLSFFLSVFSSLSWFVLVLVISGSGRVCAATMGRMFGPGKGMSSTTLPYKRRAPSWFKLKPEDLSEQFCKLAMKGMTPSSIGVTLRDSFDVAQVKMFTTIKFLRILRRRVLLRPSLRICFFLPREEGRVDAAVH